MDNERHELDDLLLHFGVKGMKWGVRRDAASRKGMKLKDRSKLKKMSNSKDGEKYLDERDSKWLEKVKDKTKVQQVAKATAKDMKKINKQLKKEYGSDVKRTFDRKAQAKFQREMKDAYDDIVSAHAYRVYKMSPTRTREVEIQPGKGGTLKAVVVDRQNAKLAKQRASISKSMTKNRKRELNHSALDAEESVDDLKDMFFIITVDKDGFPDNVISPFDDLEQNDGDETLLHYGVKGMQWGVRKSPEQLKADAQEAAAAAGEALEDAGDEVLGNDSIGEELGDVIDVLFGGKGDLEKETNQLADAIKDKLEDVGKEIKERGERMSKMLFGESKKTTRHLVATKDGFEWQEIDMD
jgi:hypothetical protein